MQIQASLICIWPRLALTLHYRNQLPSCMNKITEYFSHFDALETASAFIILFAVIDIIGSIPIIIALREKGREVNATSASLITLALLVGFFYGGDLLLQLFNVDIRAFAVAGALVILLMAMEMLCDIEIFKNEGPLKSATLVPLVFPLLAGAGSFTTLISLRAQYASINILIALLLNMLWVFIVVKATTKIEKILGQGGIYIVRKFFAVILIAVAVKLFADNISALLSHAPA